MDMKKKLTDAYMPDKSTRGEKVIIGLSGGIDSFVTAYLLKIQKYELIGVTVLVSWDDYPGNPSQGLSCFTDDQRLSSIKDFCHQLNIPHFTVKAGGEFQEDVSEKWEASRIAGTKFNPCWSCHDLRMRLLYAKTKELGAHTMATGHFAKLLHHEGHATTVHTSNDEEFDQSSLLSRLPQEILRALILPLSDLQKKEVLRLGENFGIGPQMRALRMFDCIPWNEDVLQYLLKKIPTKMQMGGELVKEVETEHVGEHEGVYRFQLGQKMDLGENRKEELFFGKYQYNQRRMILQPESWFRREKILLTQCLFPDESGIPEPMRGAARINDREIVECWIYPKSLGTVYLEWEGPIHVEEGDTVSVYKKKGKNARIFLTGRAKYVQEIKAVVQDEGEKKHVEVDYHRDL